MRRFSFFLFFFFPSFICSFRDAYKYYHYLFSFSFSSHMQLVTAVEIASAFISLSVSQTHENTFQIYVNNIHLKTLSNLYSHTQTSM